MIILDVEINDVDEPAQVFPPVRDILADLVIAALLAAHDHIKHLLRVPEPLRGPLNLPIPVQHAQEPISRVPGQQERSELSLSPTPRSFSLSQIRVLGLQILVDILIRCSKGVNVWLVN